MPVTLNFCCDETKNQGAYTRVTHQYMTTGKTMALTGWTFVGKVMSLLFNMLSRFVIVYLLRSKYLLIP